MEEKELLANRALKNLADLVYMANDEQELDLLKYAIAMTWNLCFKEKETKTEKTIKILSQEFEVIEDEHLLNEFGYIDFEKNKIVIKSGLSEDRKKITLMHETLHAILQQLGFTQENDNEHLIDSLATSLLEVLKQNQMLFF